MTKKLLFIVVSLFLIPLFSGYSQTVNCGETFTDPGGANANYANNITATNGGTTTICPDNSTDIVTVTFISFNTENCCDHLSVYSGSSSAAPLIGTFQGTVSPAVISATVPGQCLTFVFTSDGSVTAEGWVANVTCAPAPTCPTPTELATFSVTATSASLSWTNNSTATNFHVLALPCGSPAPNASTSGWIATDFNPYIFTALTPNTCYTLYVRAECSITDISDWSQAVTITTPSAPPACGGIFTDPAGANANYANSSDYTVTICPDAPGDIVTVTFTQFSTEATWDGLYVFAGNSISAPQISSNNPAGNVPGGLPGSFWGTTIPGPFESAAPGGCLTFRFRSDTSINAAGWVANVTCEPAATCPKPTSVVTSNITSTDATVGWTNNSTATTFHVLALPCGSPAPTATTTGWISTTSNPYTFTSLSPNTCYTFYVRAECSISDTSNWSLGVNATTQFAPPVCGGTFTDPAGPTANYANSTDYTVTICPTNSTDIVTVTFTEFNTEATWDGLYVYDGNSINAQQISSTNPAGNVPGGLPGSFWGTTIPGPFESSAPGGCLTFRFRSDNAVNAPGWVANVECAPAPTCPKPNGLIALSAGTNQVNLGWNSNSTATTWNVLALPCGSPPPTATSTGWQTVTTNPFVYTGLNSDTCYTFYVRGICSETDISNWSQGLSLNTQILPPVCGGTFSDTGGTTANYPNNADQAVTICPTNPGDLVTVTFTQFDVQTSADGLYVYDGNSINAPQLASTNGSGTVPGGLPGAYWGTTIPGPFTSSSVDGCLTFRFRSGTTTNTAGWLANVTCAPGPDRILLIAFVDTNTNGVKDPNENYFPYGSYVVQQNNSGVDNFINAATGYYAILDSNPNNTYDASFQINPEYAAYFSTPSTVVQDLTIPLGSGTQVINFPITNTQVYSDVSVSIVPVGQPRPNQTYQNMVMYTNTGTAPASGTLTFTRDANVTITYIGQPGAVNTPTGFTYDFANLLPFQTRTIMVTMSVPNLPIVAIGDLLTNSVSINSSNDVNANNNANSLSQTIVASYDPNDKLESHGPSILHQTFTNEDYLFYTIRFENTGTSEARSVYISDELSPLLDQTTVRMVAASHDYVLSRTDNILTWAFENINLPVSVPDTSVGKGFVTFKVKPLPGYDVGYIIYNMAQIFFESNPPIMTNLFATEFVDVLANNQFLNESFAIYPNPANTIVNIQLSQENGGITTIEIVDVLGKKVLSQKGNNEQQQIVDVSSLQAGIYFVEITNDFNAKAIKKLIIQ